MSDMTLNKSKPHGTIWGGFLHGRFFQNGQIFDGDGTHLGPADDAAAQPQAAVAAPTDDHVLAIAQARAQEHTGLLLQAVSFVEKAADKVVAELEDASDSLLDVIHSVESAGKQRAAVLAAILQVKGARAMQAEKDAQANGLTAAQAGLPAADQVAAQLNA